MGQSYSKLGDLPEARAAGMVAAMGIPSLIHKLVMVDDKSVSKHGTILWSTPGSHGLEETKAGLATQHLHQSPTL